MSVAELMPFPTADEYRQSVESEMAANRFSRDLMASRIKCRSEDLARFLQTGEAVPGLIQKIDRYFKPETPEIPAPVSKAPAPDLNGRPGGTSNGLPAGFTIMEIVPNRMRYVRVAATKDGLNVPRTLEKEFATQFVRIATNAATSELLILPSSEKSANALKINANGVLASAELAAWATAHGAQSGTRYSARLAHGGWLINFKVGAK